MVRSFSPIDMHVHLRGLEYSGHNFLELGFRDAHAVGLVAVGEQPNPTPVLTSLEAVRDRLVLSEKYREEIRHLIHIGMTNDMEQNERSLMAVMQGKYGLVSDKTFNTHSTGNMGIIDPEKRREIWMLKGKMNYRGVSIVHCENELLFTGEFDYKTPASHSTRQGEESELASIEETVKNASDSKFKGTLYVAHVSSPRSIDYLNQQKKKKLSFNIVIESTWHHMFLNIGDYVVHGNRVKMNPPLRSQRSQEEVLERVLRGEIDIIGSDHAPHPLAFKDSDEPRSGIPALPFWPKGIELLRNSGMGERRLCDYIFWSPNRIFELGLSSGVINVEYKPELWNAYGWNPFSRIDGTN